MTDTTWRNVKRFWNDPLLPDPMLHQTKQEGDRAIGDEIAAFEYIGRKTHVHMPNLEGRLGKEYLEIVEKHEVGHDRFCPYDLKTCLVLVDAADEILGDLESAKSAENMLSDIFVNTHILNKGDKSIISLYSKLSLNCSSDPVWAFYLATYEQLWGLDSGRLSRHLTSDILEEAKTNAETIRKSLYEPKEWAHTMRNFSRSIKKLRSQERKGTEGENTLEPIIGVHSPKDMAPYGNDLRAIRQLKKGLRGLSKELTLPRYKRAVYGTGVCSLSLSIVMFYTDKAAQYEIPPLTSSVTGGSMVPVYRKEWSAEDPVETLDLIHSLENSGRIIPEENTYFWQHDQGSGTDISREYRDLLIVHDSSGSMPNPTDEFSLPCLSSIILAHSAINNDRQVAVINFSSDHHFCGYTSNRYKVDEAILRYPGEETDIPGTEILSAVQSNPAPQHIVLSTDTQIDCIESQIPYLEQAIKTAGSGSIFLYGKKTGTAQRLEDIGFKVYLATSMDDLVSLSIGLSRNLYG